MDNGVSPNPDLVSEVEALKAQLAKLEVRECGRPLIFLEVYL
jgi:hypothetical protein